MFSGLSAFVLGLEKRHFPPENRRVSDGRVLLRRLKETLLAEAGVLIGMSEGDKGSVILDDLARESALVGTVVTVLSALGALAEANWLSCASTRTPLS